MLYNPAEPVGTDPAPTRPELLKIIRGYAQIVPVANTTARNALVSTLSSRGFTPSATNPLLVWRADIGAVEQTTDGTTWRALGLERPAGRISASWTSSLGSGGAVSLTDDGSRQGGMTYSSPNGGGLVAPVTGLYLIAYNAYFSGPVGNSWIVARIWRGGAVIKSLGNAGISKGGDDATASRTEVIALQAGDIVTLYGYGPASAWGDSSRTGTSLNIALY